MATNPLDSEPPPLITVVTVGSLFAVLVLLIAAYVLSLRVLARDTPTSLRVIYIWHAFDALIHLLLEGPFLYNCFFEYAPGTSPDNFLSQPLRVYGPAYGTSPLSKLWQEYGKADARWLGADLTIISLEILTVFIGGPLAVYVCERMQKQDRMVWFWMVILATGELYGGFMTFNPEWLTGSLNLDTSNAMYLWLYLVFFNGLWVALPLYVLYEAYGQLHTAFSALDGSSKTKGRRGGAAAGKEKKAA
ncbi:MAG: hypothetical protein M1838_005500 [Thelocarpon superellum]|nr:MAG: hypothetical protein M1838_005500 [Thelocarpon superellum]